MHMDVCTYDLARKIVPRTSGMSHAWEKIEALSFWRAEVGFDVVKQLWMGIPLLYLFYAYEDAKYVPLASGPEIEGFKYYCSLCVLKKFYYILICF